MHKIIIVYWCVTNKYNTRHAQSGKCNLLVLVYYKFYNLSVFLNNNITLKI